MSSQDAPAPDGHPHHGEPQDISTATSPAIDMLAGGFFLAWAAVGWTSYMNNIPLRASLGAGADPGPALLALITLWLLTIGGLVIAGIGAYRWTRVATAERSHDLPHPKDHIRPVCFALTVIAAAIFMRPLGFILCAFVFCLLWLYVLPAGRSVSLRHGALAIALAAILTFGVYYIFARFLLVPLPR